MKGIDLTKDRIGADGISRSWKTIETFFENEFYQGIADELKRKKDNAKKNIKPILSNIHNDLREIMLAKPDQLNDYCNRWDAWKSGTTLSKKVLKKLHKYLSDAFNYDSHRTRLNRLAVILNIKTCLYCNQQYTLAIGNKPRQDGGISLHGSVAFLQFDHFFEKSKYPFLAMSLYNLIPSCPLCNQRKSYKDISIKLHPYVNDLSSQFKFKIKNPDAFINPKNPDLDVLEMEIITNGDADVNEFLKDLKIKKRYERHLDEVQALEVSLYLSNYYNDWFNSLATTIYGCVPTDNRTINALERYLKGFYSKPEDINKRPLTKFSQDIYEQLASLYTIYD